MVWLPPHTGLDTRRPGAALVGGSHLTTARGRCATNRPIMSEADRPVQMRCLVPTRWKRNRLDDSRQMADRAGGQRQMTGTHAVGGRDDPGDSLDRRVKLDQ